MQRHKAFFFKSLDDFVSHRETEQLLGGLTRLNYFRRWRRRFLQRSSLKQQVQKLCDVLSQTERDCRRRQQAAGLFWMKSNLQKWKIKGALCKALLERQDFRRIRSFKVLQNLAKAGRLFFKVVIGCVLRKEHLHKKVASMKIRKEARAHLWETQRHALGVFDLLRIHNNTYSAPVDKPLLSLLSRRPQKLMVVLHNLAVSALKRHEESSEQSITDLIQRADSMSSKALSENPLLMAVLLSSILKTSIYAKKRLLLRGLRKLQLAAIQSRRDIDRRALCFLTQALQHMRHRPANYLSSLVLSSRHAALKHSHSAQHQGDREAYSLRRSIDRLSLEIGGVTRHGDDIRRLNAVKMMMAGKMKACFDDLRLWSRESEINERMAFTKRDRLGHIFAVILTNKERQAFIRITREASKNVSASKFLTNMKRKVLKSCMRSWRIGSKKGAHLIRKAFFKIEEELTLDIRHTMRKLRINVTGMKSKNLLDQIEMLNENISESNNELLAQTQENFRLENEIRKRSVRSQASLIRFLLRATNKRRLLELRMCLLNLANFSNYTRKATFLLSAINRSFIRSEASAFYLLERESIVDQEKFLVQQVKNFRDDTAEIMIEREELNQQTLTFVEDRTTFEMLTEVLSKRLAIASEEAAFRALKRARKVEEQAVLRMRIKMWRGRRRRLELLRAFMDNQSSEFTARKRKKVLRLWKNQISKVKFFKKGYESLIKFVKHKELKQKGLGYRITSDRSFETEQYHLSVLVEQGQKKIAIAAEDDLRIRLFRITSTILKLIENRKYSQFMRFFEITILNPKKKLVSNIRGQPLANRNRLNLLSKYFKNYRLNYQATQKRKTLEDRRLSRQKLYLMKLFQINVVMSKQTKLNCSYLSSIFSSISSDRSAEAFNLLAHHHNPTPHRPPLAAALHLLDTATGVVHVRRLRFAKAVLQRLMLPSPRPHALMSVVASVCRRKRQLVFDMIRNAGRSDNVVGRYLVAKARPIQPREDSELLKLAFGVWSQRSSTASRRYRAAEKIHSMLNRPLTFQVALRSWRELLNFDRIELSSRNPDDAYRR